MNMKGSKELHDIEVKVRLNKRQSEKLDQLAALTDIPRAVIIRTIFERAIERGARHYLIDDRTQHASV